MSKNKTKPEPPFQELQKLIKPREKGPETSSK
jgi:hypothetical protein